MAIQSMEMCVPRDTTVHKAAQHQALVLQVERLHAQTELMKKKLTFKVSRLHKGASVLDQKSFQIFFI